MELVRGVEILRDREALAGRREPARLVVLRFGFFVDICRYSRASSRGPGPAVTLFCCKKSLSDGTWWCRPIIASRVGFGSLPKAAQRDGDGLAVHATGSFAA